MTRVSFILFKSFFLFSEGLRSERYAFLQAGQQLVRPSMHADADRSLARDRDGKRFVRDVEGVPRPFVEDVELQSFPMLR